VAAALCILTGVLSIFIIPVIDGVTSSVLGISIASKLVNGLVLSPPAGEFSSMSPVALAACRSHWDVPPFRLAALAHAGLLHHA
jgi:hydrogenase-4 component B